MKELSLAEQLQAQSGKLKKVDNTKKPKMSQQQEMKVTTQMATLQQKLAVRQKALGNNKKGKADGSDEDDDEALSGDDWEESD